MLSSDTVMSHSSRCVQAISAISSVVDSQNLPGTALVLRVAFKIKPPTPRHLLSIWACSWRARRALWLWVFIVACLVASRVLQVPIFDDFEGGTPVVDEDGDAIPDAGCQRKAADSAPPADPLNVQSALPLHSGHARGWEGLAPAWTDSGRLLIFTTTRQESGPAMHEVQGTSGWSTRDIRKQGSRPCCRGTFHCPT